MIRALVLAAVLVACKQNEVPPSRTAFYATSFTRQPSAAEMTALGRLVFSDRSLSASGDLACATCHDPASAYGPANDLAVQRGGRDGTLAGQRATPSLRYLQAVPRFSEHYHEPDGDGTDQGPTGGFAWDGRAMSTHEQAKLPLYSPLEMANRDVAELAARLRRSPHATRFRAAFGSDVLDTDASSETALLLVLEVFQQSAPDFYPYSSKYDAVLRGKATLADSESRGRAIFDDPHKGNCASCHPSRNADSGFPAFTDFGFVALGVPRNPAIAANADPEYFDLGLCGPLRTDLATHPEYCGMFKTPSLRNVARRHRFMHNGVFTSLDQVIRFYTTRDRDPAKWPKDDLPARYLANLNTDPPFGHQPEPVLTDEEITSLVAFLGTLDDGFSAEP